MTPHPLIPILITALIAGCTLTFDDGPKPLRINWITPHNSRVTTRPVISGVFSSPVTDVNAQFSFDPPVPSAYTVIHKDRDTFHLDPGVTLDGNTRYVIRPARAITSSAGATLNPSEDSLVIITWQSEHEPNNSFPMADTIDSILCAALPTSNDTDFIVCIDSCASITIQSTQGRAFFTVFTQARDSIAVSSRDVDSATVTLPVSVESPVYIRVLPSVRVAEGSYILHITRR